MPTGTCLLCGTETELKLSHVLPAFVYRWMKESSGGGFLRNHREPNRRVQDGEKFHWLCGHCEQRFGGWEKTFAERLFYPYLEKSGGTFPYAHWLTRFCVSVSWRVLHYHLQAGGFADWSPEATTRIRAAETAWREYVLGRRQRPGKFQQHLLPVDRIESATMPPVPNINRYLMRVVHTDVCRGTESLFTYAKLGRFLILGFIHEPHLERWAGTRVQPVQGGIRPRTYRLPAALLEFIKDRAREIRDVHSQLSERQRQKIDAALRENIDRLANSDQFAALRADVDMFGDEAFDAPDGSENS